MTDKAILTMLEGFLAYPHEYNDAIGGKVGDDAILGPEWANIGMAIIGLLQGPTSRRLYCGLIDGQIREAIEAQGYNPDIEDWND